MVWIFKCMTDITSIIDVYWCLWLNIFTYIIGIVSTRHKLFASCMPFFACRIMYVVFLNILWQLRSEKLPINCCLFYNLKKFKAIVPNLQNILDLFRNWFSTQNLPYHSYNGNYITELSDKKKNGSTRFNSTGFLVLEH